MLPVLQAFDRDNQLAGIRESTRANFYNSTLTNLCSFLLIPDLRLLKREHVESFLLHKQRQKLSPVSVQTYYRAIRRFTRWMAEEGYTDTDVCLGMRRPRAPKTERRIPTKADMIRLINGVSKSNFYRDQCIILLAVDGNLRAGEVRSLQLDDIDWEDSLVRVTGKGGHQRYVPIGRRTLLTIDAYKEKERPPSSDRTLILSDEGHALTRGGFAQVFRRMKAKTGITCRYHDLRHYGSTDDARHMSPWDLQQKLGHSSMKMTQQYVHLGRAMDRYSTGDALVSR